MKIIRENFCVIKLIVDATESEMEKLFLNELSVSISIDVLGDSKYALTICCTPSNVKKILKIIKGLK